MPNRNKPNNKKKNKARKGKQPAKPQSSFVLSEYAGSIVKASRHPHGAAPIASPWAVIGRAEAISSSGTFTGSAGNNACISANPFAGYSDGVSSTVEASHTMPLAHSDGTGTSAITGMKTFGHTALGVTGAQTTLAPYAIASLATNKRAWTPIAACLSVRYSQQHLYAGGRGYGFLESETFSAANDYSPGSIDTYTANDNAVMKTVTAFDLSTEWQHIFWINEAPSPHYVASASGATNTMPMGFLLLPAKTDAAVTFEYKYTVYGVYTGRFVQGRRNFIGDPCGMNAVIAAWKEKLLSSDKAGGVNIDPRRIVAWCNHQTGPAFR